MVGNLLQTAYNLTDAYFLGKLGAADLSAPSIVLQLIIVFNAFGGSRAMAFYTNVEILPY